MSGASGSEDGEDPLKEARAYNDSILFMVCVPYALLGVCIFGVAWGLWKNSKLQAARLQQHLMMTTESESTACGLAADSSTQITSTIPQTAITAKEHP